MRSIIFALSVNDPMGDSVQLQIEQVTKKYGKEVMALRGVTLNVGVGVLGLLGPNGAGKTTLMNILSTITTPTQGRVLWNGEDVSVNPNAIRNVLGYLPQNFGVYPHLTAMEFLEYLAAVKGLEHRAAIRRIDELLQLVNLHEFKNRRLGKFSGGMRQRIGIAQALLNDPELLIIDEPTVGLDPEERVRFRNLISDLAGDRIVILSTHIVSDVETTATDIALVAGGELLAHEAPEKLLATVEGRVWECVIASSDVPALKQRYLTGGALRRADGVHMRIVTEDPPSGAVSVLPSLEEAYLYCTSRAASARVARA
jgi:ABC-2 type transport system ATP-binding protein